MLSADGMRAFPQVGSGTAGPLKFERNILCDFDHFSGGGSLLQDLPFTTRGDAAQGLSQESHTTGSICDILCSLDHQNLRGLTPILADIPLTHPFVGNAVNREQWGTHQGKGLSPIYNNGRCVR